VSIQSKANQALITVAAMADPRCTHPRKRLAKMRRILEGDTIDKLDLARVLLADAATEECSPRRRALWSKTTKRLAREQGRRYQAVLTKARIARRKTAAKKAEAKAER
jgi:hypothetical protein